MFRISVATINNLILICLLWLIVLITLYYVSETIYSNPDPIKSENIIAQLPNTTNASDKPIATKSLDMRLASGDLEHGRKLFGECGLCHIPAQNGPNRLGPNLWQIVGRPVGSISGFNYSSAMRQLGQSDTKWDFQSLDAFLTAPQRTIKGTIMTYKGMKDPQDRADLLLYLRSLSDNPLDLPNADGAKDDIGE